MTSIPDELRKRTVVMDGTLSGTASEAAASLLICVALIVRALAIGAYRIDSDEPQHLHVAWAWSRGLVQYRDVFDNHLPLFHLLTAPFVGLFDGNPEVFIYARLLMLPLFLATLALTFVIARTVASPNVALWSVAFLALFPSSLLKSVEFRNDSLCIVLTLAGLALLLRSGMANRSLLLSGLAFGAAFASSLKTAVFLAALVVTASIFLYVRTAARPALAEAVRVVAVFLAGFAIFPAAIVALFARLGALHEMIFSAYTYNSMFHVPVLRGVAGALAFPFALAAVVRVARRATSSGPLLFTTILAAAFPITLLSFWPLITTRDFLPLVPLVAVVAATFGMRDRIGNTVALATTVAVAELIATFVSGSLASRPPQEFPAIVRDALALTRPGEPVLDLKGETVFRTRPSTYILEVVGRSLMAEGRLPDTFARDYVSTGCRVVSADLAKFPPASRAFFETHTVAAGSLRVAGATLDEARGWTFDIAVPDTYVFATADGIVAGMLDGVESNGVAALAPGAHRFVPVDAKPPLVCVWRRAVEAGYYRNRFAATRALARRGAEARGSGRF